MLRCIQGKYLLINGKLRGIGTVEITNYSIKNEDLADDAVDERVIKDNIDLSTIGVIARTKTSLITADSDLDLGSYGLKIGGTTVIDSSRNLVNIGSITASNSIVVNADDIGFVLRSPSLDGDVFKLEYSTTDDAIVFRTPFAKDFQFNGRTRVQRAGGTYFLQLKATDGLGVWIRFENADGGIWYVGMDSNEEFHIEDVATGTQPFKIIKGAPSNALMIDSSGNLVIGVANAELKVKQGFTIHLDKDAEGSYSLRITRSDGTLIHEFTEDGEARVPKLQIMPIGGSPTTVISSDRVLQNVNIDRATTDLPPCKVLEDRREHTAYNDSDSTAPIYALATDTYVDSDSVGYKQVKIIYEAKCDNGVGWAVKVEDDSGNVLYENNGTNTSYSTYSSGWIDFPAATTKLKVYVGAYYDGTTADTGYIRNIRIYCR